MDAERRNRVAALLATADQLPSAIGRELLADHDAALESQKTAVGVLSQTQQHIHLAMERAEAHQADAARLANWIIHHPTPGPEMTEVLNLHDRV